MLKQRFIHLIRPNQALLIVMLCGLITASTSAYGKDNRTSGRDYGMSNAKNEAGANDGKKSKNKQPDSSSVRSESSQRESSNQQRSDYRKIDTYKPTDSKRSSQRPDTNYSQPNGWSNRDDNQGNQPNKRSKPTMDNRNYQSPDKVQVYKYGRDQDRNYNQSNKYEQPNYRGGRYYYSSRPNYKPCNYGYWAFEYDSQSCRKSVYFNFGFFPYVQLGRISITPYIKVSYRGASVVIDDSYYLSRNNNAGLDNTLADIRSTWLEGRFDLIRNHVSRGQSIAILLNGRYDYSLDSDDYLQMTSDAVNQIQTVSFTWESIRQRTDGNYTAFGRHTYYDISGMTKTVYVSYTIRRIGSYYDIVEVGSSSSHLSY